MMRPAPARQCVDPCMEPAPGMLVITAKTQRRVTFARDGEVRYVETRNGRQREGGCLLSTWRTWCKTHDAAEERPF